MRILGTEYFDWSQKLVKSIREQFCSIVSFSRVKLRCKISLLVISEILGLFVNTLAADDEYSSHKSEKFSLANQMELSKKLKLFYQFFIAFLEPTSNFPHTEKNNELHSSSNSENIDFLG